MCFEFVFHIFERHVSTREEPNMTCSETKPHTINPVAKSTDDWIIDYNKELGYGKFGNVYMGSKISKKQPVAIKVIPMKGNHQLKSEQMCLTILSKDEGHPNIVKLVDSFQTSMSYCLVLELCDGIELFDEIHNRYTGMSRNKFTEEEVKNLMWQIFDSITYIHDRGIIHRDLKPENFRYNPVNHSLKMLDFGLSRNNSNNLDRNSPVLKYFNSRVGTTYYIAPEVFRQNYSQNCDNWSAGIIFYILLCGYAPFNGDDESQIISNIKYGTLTFNVDFTGVSLEAVDLIRRLLNRAEEKRLTAREALNHEWFIGFDGKICI